MEMESWVKLLKVMIAAVKGRLLQRDGVQLMAVARHLPVEASPRSKAHISAGDSCFKLDI